MRIIGVILSLLLFGYSCKESAPSGEIAKVESKEEKQISTPLERGNQKMILLEAEDRIFYSKIWLGDNQNRNRVEISSN